MDARDSVLVTGAYGLVGRPVVELLVADGYKVTATAHRTVKPSLPAAVDVRSVDLTKPDQVSAVIADVSPSAIVHLAAFLLGEFRPQDECPVVELFADHLWAQPVRGCL